MNAKPELLTAALDKDPRWTAVAHRDSRLDGEFVYAVKTTGAYCRPSCPSRLANRANVEFFDRPESAEARGYRACQRCKPNGESIAEWTAKAIAEACRLIETAQETPSLAQLASAAGLSPHHFHRQFKATTGLTPRAYGAALRAKRVRAELAENETSVTDAIYAAGFNASSRFYEKSAQVLGMTPTAFKRGGENEDIRFAIGQCSLGAILVARSNKGLCTIALGDDPDALARDLQDRFPRARLVGDDGEFEKTVAKVVGFVEAPHIGFDLPLDVRGSAFEERVWRALQDIPPGETASYLQVARRIGEPRSARAVARACAANTIAVDIPCHRVVRTDGALSGYRWGVERKRALLQKENAR